MQFYYLLEIIVASSTHVFGTSTSFLPGFTPASTRSVLASEKRAKAAFSGPASKGKCHRGTGTLGGTLTLEQGAARPRQRFLCVANTLRCLRASLSPQFASHGQRAVQDRSPWDDVFIRWRSRLKGRAGTQAQKSTAMLWSTTSFASIRQVVAIQKSNTP